MFNNNKKKLTPNQSGNKKHHSNATLNIAVTDAILAAMDKKMLSALILMDLSKAFDSIDHLILLRKLNKVGASPTTVKWFQSYLSDRTQIVRIGSSLSSSLSTTHGVPQGAILSPLLFCIYINDMPQLSVTSLLESYVDDSKLLLSFMIQDVDNAILSLQNDLSGITKWCCENKLLVNPRKTKFMLIGTRQLLFR
jgi:retron-type reverse transcriptase